jgi:hypothetical protein
MADKKLSQPLESIGKHSKQKKMNVVKPNGVIQFQGLLDMLKALLITERAKQRK